LAHDFDPTSTEKKKKARGDWHNKTREGVNLQQPKASRNPQRRPQEELEKKCSYGVSDMQKTGVCNVHLRKIWDRSATGLKRRSIENLAFRFGKGPEVLRRTNV